MISETLYFQASEFRNAVSHPLNAKRTGYFVSMNVFIFFSFTSLFNWNGSNVCAECNNDRMRSKIRNKIAAHSACVRTSVEYSNEWTILFSSSSFSLC